MIKKKAPKPNGKPKPSGKGKGRGSSKRGRKGRATPQQVGAIAHPILDWSAMIWCPG